MELIAKLKERDRSGDPVRVGIVGMHIAAIADIAIERPLQTFGRMGWARDDIQTVRSVGEAEDAVRCDDMLTEDNFSPNRATFVYGLRALQDSLVSTNNTSKPAPSHGRPLHAERED